MNFCVYIYTHVGRLQKSEIRSQQTVINAFVASRSLENQRKSERGILLDRQDVKHKLVFRESLYDAQTPSNQVRSEVLEIRWSLGSLPTKTIQWFYDSVTTELKN